MIATESITASEQAVPIILDHSIDLARAKAHRTTHAPVQKQHHSQETSKVTDAGTSEASIEAPPLQAVRMTEAELLAAFPGLADAAEAFHSPDESDFETVTITMDEDAFLTADDLQILAEFRAQLATAAPEDFGIVTEALPKTLPELQPPAETPPAVIAVVEEIAERIAALSPEAVTDVQNALHELTDNLHAVEHILRSDPSAPEYAASIETAQAALVLSVRKLCESLGLEYSDAQITELVASLIAQPELTHELDSTQADGAETLLAIGKGTHERLRWFLATVRHHIKKQVDWLHRLLGRHALASVRVAPVTT